MKLNRTESPLSRTERNKINENWSVIESNYNNFAEEALDNIVELITEETYQQIIDSSKLEWQEPVDSESGLPSESDEGDTRMVRDTGKVYRFNGNEWQEIQQIDAGPVNELDNRVNAQLADTENNIISLDDKKTEKTEVTGVNKRIDNLVLQSGGDSNLEVVDARTSSVKDKTYEVIGDRINAIESDSYFPIKNIIKNGNFSDGVTDWVGQYGDITSSSNKLKHIANGTNAYPRIRQNTGYSTHSKRYVSLRARALSDDCRILRVRWGTTTSGNVTHVSLPTKDRWYTFNGVVDTNESYLYVYHEYTSDGQALNKGVEIEQVLSVDLTTTFGVGKEPTQEKFEELLKVFPNSWFGGVENLANQKRVLPFLLLDDQGGSSGGTSNLSYKYPFDKSAALRSDEKQSESLLKAIKDIRIYNAKAGESYHLHTLRRKRLAGGNDNWEIIIADSSNAYVLGFTRVNFVEETGANKVYLTAINKTGLSGHVIIDWAELDATVNWGGMTQAQTKLDPRVYFGSNDKTSKVDNTRNQRSFYWQNFKDSIRKVDEKQGINTLSFNIMTDIHMETERTRIMTSVEAGSAFAEYADLDFTALLGDYIIGDLTKNESLKLINDIMVSAKKYTKAPILSVKGNHDSNDQPPGYMQMTPEELKPYLISNKEYFQADTRKALQYGIVVDANNPYGGYYYKDFDRQKIRGIFLNTNEMNEIDGELQFPNHVWTGVRTPNQLEWLANTALQVDDGWAVAIFMHIPSVEESYMHYRGNVIPAFDNIIQGFVNKTSGISQDGGTGAYVEYDFTNQNDTEMIGFFCGHVHEDSHAVINGVNVFISNSTTPKKRWETGLDRDTHGLNTLSMNTVIINRDTRTVNVVKTGTGQDYEFTW